MASIFLANPLRSKLSLKVAMWVFVGVAPVALYPITTPAQWTTNGNNINNTNTGNVGIGTAGPGSKLEINLAGTEGTGLNVLSGASNKYALIQWGRTSAEGVLAISRSAGAFFANSVPGDAWFGSINGTIAFGDQTAGTASLIVKSGNVGIGTASPEYRLDVNGAVNATAGFQSLNSAANIGFRDGDENYRAHSFWIGNTNADGGKYAGLTNYPGANTSVVSDGIFFVAPYTNNWDKWIPTLSIRGTSANGAGNVGIGITSPNYRLDVQGGQINASGGLCIAGICKTDWSQVGGGGSPQWTNNSLGIDYSSGNVGIGATSPSVKLEVAPNSAIKLGNAYFSSGGDYVHLANNEWYNGTSWTASAPGALIQISGQDVNFYRHDAAGSHTQSMNINSSGNVGIGKSNPTVALDVQGDIKASGTIFAKYQDLAEWVPSSEQLTAGTVVVLDTTKSNQVVSATVAYDTRVAGVISAQPGITLGEGGEGKVLVATTGRVRVKVDASRAPIQIGDLLVTSDVSGVAMKSEAVNLGGVQIHRPGTIIGKALEPLAKGQGEILVLLSLQ